MGNALDAFKAQQKAAEKGTTKTVPAGAVGTVSA